MGHLVGADPVCSVNQKPRLRRGKRFFLVGEGSVGVRAGSNVGGGVNWDVLNANRSAVLSLLSLLGLELQFQQFDFLLLLHQSELGFSR